jgi:cytochrome c biogenesis factor
MSEEHRYSEAAESDDEQLPLTRVAAVQVTKRPAAAVLTSQAEPRFVKVHKSRTSAKTSKQSTGRDLLTVLGKKPTPTAKVGGGARLCEEGWCTAALQFPRVVWALLRAS